MGRIKAGAVHKQAISLTLSPENIALIKIIGEGNASKGLEKLLEPFQALYQTMIDKQIEEEEDLLS